MKMRLLMVTPGDGNPALPRLRKSDAGRADSLAEELKPKNITVNAVLPSIIDTPANRASMPDADFNRWVAPRALASVILFLACDAARAVTGALLAVTGRL